MGMSKAGKGVRYMQEFRGQIVGLVRDGSRMSELLRLRR